MATPWPATLPDTFDTSGYSETWLDNTIETKPEGGSRIVRKRFSSVPREVKGTMILTAAQRTTLDDFYKLYCAERWSWTDVRGQARFYNFKEPPKFTMLSGLYYRVSLDLLEYTTEFGGG